jgi:hypothetical protein
MARDLAAAAAAPRRIGRVKGATVCAGRGSPLSAASILSRFFGSARSAPAVQVPGALMPAFCMIGHHLSISALWWL